MSSSVLLGDDVVESQSDLLAAGRAEAFGLRAAASGVAREIHIYVDPENSASTVTVGLYNSAGGHPGVHLRSATVPVSESGTWITARIHKIALVSGATYWLAILGQGGTLRYRDRAQGSCTSETSARSKLHHLPVYWKVGKIYADCPVSAYVTGAAPPPANTSPPTLLGSAKAGLTLRTTVGRWTGAPTSYGYQWQECDALGVSCLNVKEGTAPSLTLGAEEIDDTVRDVVTATNESGSNSAPSEVSELVAPPPPGAPTSTTLPSVSGIAQVGHALTASPGTWTEDPTSFVYQWQDCDRTGKGCSNVSGAISSTYEPVPGDVGQTVRVLVTASNEGGSASAASETSEAVAPEPPPAPVNTSLPTIGGSTVEGQTLAAGNGSWSGNPTSFAYQWQDCNTAGEACTSIAGGTSATYRLTGGDVGHTLRLAVTASNAGGSTPASSVASAVVTSSVPAAPTDTALPVVSGSVVEGKTLSASTGTWSGSPTAFAYQWQDCNTAGGACAAIAAATASTYELAGSDVGHTVRVVVTASNTGGSTPASSLASAIVTSSVQPAPTDTVAPEVSGSTVEGQTLSASAGTWSGSPTSFAYQWQDCNSAGGACAAIGGATATTYKLTGTDVGHALRVVVTASNAGGSTPASSAATATVLPPAPTDTALPGVSGSTVEGQTLSASAGTWSGSPTSFAYQWQDCNTAGGACAAIGGATSATYELAGSDVGHTVRVVVTASDAGGSTPASSAATATVLPPAPADTALPQVSGSAVEGQTLSASAGTWSGSPTSFAYQWQDCNTAGSACAAIGGATSATYELAGSDVGHAVRVVVTASNAGGSTPASSSASATVTSSVPLAPTDTVLPQVSGSAVEGQTLSASTGTWSGSPTSFAYQWQDCNASGEGCAAIGGATSATYELAGSDVGHAVRVVVTASNAGGSTPASSAATVAVVAAAGDSCSYTVNKLTGPGGAAEDLEKSGSPTVCLEEGAYEGPKGQSASEAHEVLEPAVYKKTEEECEEVEWRRKCWLITKGPSSGTATLKPVPGAKVAIAGFIGLDASNITLEGIKVQVMRVGWKTDDWGTAENDTLRGLVGRRFLIWGAHHVTVEDSEWGPAICDEYGNARSYATKVAQDGEGWPSTNAANSKLQSATETGGVENEYITIKGDVFKGIQAYVFPGKSGECHSEALAVFSGNHVVVTENKFYEDAIYDIYTQSNSGGHVNNLTISKNWMGATEWALHCSAATQSQSECRAAQEAAEGGGTNLCASCQNSLDVDNTENIEVVANHIDSAFLFEGSSFSNVKVSYNVSKLSYESISYCALYPGVEWKENVWKVEKAKACGGKGDIGLGPEALPFVNQEDDSSMNYTLTGAYAEWPE